MPYRIIKSNDAQVRRQLSDADNMATVQTDIEKNDHLTVPTLCQSSLYGTQSVTGQLDILGELVIADYP